MLRALVFTISIAFVFPLAACSSDDDDVGSRAFRPVDGARVSIFPREAEVPARGTQQFRAEVTGAADPTVLWAVESEDGGAIDASGLYTAPWTPGTYRIVAISKADPSVRGTASVIVYDENARPISVQVEPTEVDLDPGEGNQFRAAVQGTDDSRVTWSVVEEGGGTISAEGWYQAPQSAGVYTVVARSVADSSRLGSARVRVGDAPGLEVKVSPAVAEVQVGKTVQFTAEVQGANSGEVSWSVREAGGGTITEDGLYTAPDRAGTFTVVATSRDNPSWKGTARVVVVRPPDPDGLLPDDRLTVWNPGLNPVGGIPSDDDPVRPALIYLPPGNPYDGYSVDPALAGTGRDASRAIQEAIEAAAAEASETSRRVVLLPPGTFTIANREGLEIRSYVTLRGQGPRGPNATRLVKPNDTVGPVVVMGHLWMQTTQHIDLARDVAHGDRQAEVVSNPGYRVGELVFLSQMEDEVNVGSKWNPRNQSSTEVRGWYSRNNRPTGQVLEITAIEGNVLTFSTPVRLPYLRSNGAQLSRFAGWQANGPAVPTMKWMGVEGIYMRRGELGTVKFAGASYSWARDIETEESFDGGVVFEYAFRCTLRDSFIHSTGWPEPGGAGYGLDVTFYSADNLIENNIFWRFNKVMSFRASGGGNVVAYNYVEDGYGASYPQIPEVGLNASHYATPHHELFEGNLTWNISGDSYWGNSTHMTFLRNHVTGRRRSVPPLRLTDETERRFVDVPEWHIKYSFVGNVLGTPGMTPEPQSGYVYENQPPWRYDPVPLWTIGPQYDSGLGGQDERVVATTIRHGNFDFFTESIAWDPGIERRELPPSLYLDRKPAFFGDLPWPWVTPEADGEKFHTLPARERFDALLGLD